MKIIAKLSLLVCFMVNLICHGQTNDKFSNIGEYFNHVEKKFSIDTSSIHYIPDNIEKSVIIFPSIIYFAKDSLLMSIDEISNEVDTKCSPKKLFKQLSYKLVDSLLTKKGQKSDLILKNLKSKEIIKPNDEIIVVFLFSIHLRRLGDRYIKQKEILEKYGFRTMILSMDMPYIEGVKDYSKINQIRFKTQ